VARIALLRLINPMLLMPLSQPKPTCAAKQHQAGQKNLAERKTTEQWFYLPVFTKFFSPEDFFYPQFYPYWILQEKKLPGTVRS
jgi:hypothetical protein